MQIIYSCTFEYHNYQIKFDDKDNDYSFVLINYGKNWVKSSHRKDFCQKHPEKVMSAIIWEEGSFLYSFLFNSFDIKKINTRKLQLHWIEENIVKNNMIKTSDSSYLHVN